MVLKGDEALGVEKYSDKNPGLVLVAFGPGVRHDNKALGTYYGSECSAVPVNSNDGICAVAAFINGMSVCVGYENNTVLRQDWEKLNPKILGFSEQTYLVQRMKRLINSGYCSPKCSIETCIKICNGEFWFKLKFVAGECK